MDDLARDITVALVLREIIRLVIEEVGENNIEFRDRKFRLFTEEKGWREVDVRLIKQMIQKHMDSGTARDVNRITKQLAEAVTELPET